MQTAAIFLDAYRDLNSRKLFWLALVVSGLGVALLALLGINEEGVTIFGLTLNIPFLNTNFISRATFYKMIFNGAGVWLWLSWIACILALISTASVVPELLASGSIDMMLSKPIGRARLFLTRWSTGLLFVGIQAAVFSLAGFLVIGIRGGAWEPVLFLAVPVLVLFFSFLFCVSALVGVLTRSTIASLIVTLIFWMVLAGVQWVEWMANMGRISAKLETEALATLVATTKELSPETSVATLEQELLESKEALARWEQFYWPTFAVVAVLPKTSQTTDWLRRQLLQSAQIGRPSDDETYTRMFGTRHVRRKVFEEALRKDTEERQGAAWVMGTSLAFEAAVLGACVFLFRRKDF